MKQIELLAPAKNLEYGKIAINYGADAVYIGVEGFSARQNAGNSVADITELVKYAHFFNAKVYAALNILLKNNELSIVSEIIQKLYKANVDALIIQDPKILKLNLPPIPLHASTQMDNRTLEHIQNLEKAGFERVILARELSLEQIKHIKNNSNIELECFVHGALCVSYSGRCFISEHLCGRSANRGECAQICRQVFNLLDKNGNYLIKDKHLLSLKDFNNSENIEKLMDIGVQSFKIEGRLKDENYVKNVVAYYRKKMGEKTKSSSGHTNFLFEPNVVKSFNRGFTDYFFDEKRKNRANFDTPKSLGEYLGKWDDIFGKAAIHNNEIVLHNGDGLVFVGENGDILGTYYPVNRDKISGLLSNNSGSYSVYRNFDIEFDKMLTNDKSKRVISLEMRVMENIDNLEITAKDEDGNEVSLSFSKSQEKAKNIEQTVDNFKKNLTKSGEFPFEIKVTKMEIEGFYRIAEINEMRRQILEKIHQLRMKHFATRFVETAYTETTQIDTLELYNSAVNHLMHTKYCLKFELRICPKNVETNVANGFTALAYAGMTQVLKPEEVLFLETGSNKFRLQFDCKNCEMYVDAL